MLKNNNFGCGKIQSNRKYFPNGILKDDNLLKKEKIDIVNSNEVSISKWKARGQKCVNVISNMHDTSYISSLTRRNIRGVQGILKAPISIVDYNKYMGGVDHFDQYHSYYNVAWKSRRWRFKIFYYLLDASKVNLFVLYKKTSSIHEPKLGKIPTDYLDLFSESTDR